MSDEDTDLSGLDLSAAKEYIFAYALDAKRLEKEISEAEAEIAKWKGRAALAEGKIAESLARGGASGGASGGDATQMTSLAEAARAKVAELASFAEARGAERAELIAKVETMRRQLPLIRSRERSVDPDRLLAELQLMTGELLGDASGAAEGGRSEAATEADFAKLEADAKAQADLDALKKRAMEADK
jgi:hypothetical protein